MDRATWRKKKTKRKSSKMSYLKEDCALFHSIATPSVVFERAIVWYQIIINQLINRKEKTDHSNQQVAIRNYVHEYLEEIGGSLHVVINDALVFHIKRMNILKVLKLNPLVYFTR